MDKDPEAAELTRSLLERDLCCVDPYANPDPVDSDEDDGDFLRADFFFFSSTDGKRTRFALVSMGDLSGMDVDSGGGGGGVGNLFTNSPSSSSVESAYAKPYSEPVLGDGGTVRSFSPES